MANKWLRKNDANELAKRKRSNVGKHKAKINVKKIYAAYAASCGNVKFKSFTKMRIGPKRRQNDP